MSMCPQCNCPLTDYAGILFCLQCGFSYYTDPKPKEKPMKTITQTFEIMREEGEELSIIELRNMLSSESQLCNDRGLHITETTNEHPRIDLGTEVRVKNYLGDECERAVKAIVFDPMDDMNHVGIQVGSFPPTPPAHADKTILGTPGWTDVKRKEIWAAAYSFNADKHPSEAARLANGVVKDFDEFFAKGE